MKKFMIGLILGAGLMVGVSAQAEVVSLVGEIIEGQFPVKVDGTTVNSPGVVVDGTSYLPVREFGELLGYDVSFNADMGVELRKKPQPIAQEVLDQRVIERQIQRIEDKIYSVQLKIHSEQSNLNSPHVIEERKELAKERIPEFEAEIEALEAEKATLQAQLTP